MSKIEGKLETHQDHVRTSAADSITSVAAALEELIANSAGSYINTSKDELPLGEIMIHYDRSKGEKANFTVTDHGCGMNGKRLNDAFTVVGAHTAETQDRNIFGRGAKDCAAIGSIRIDTIQNDTYSWYLLKRDTKYTGEINQKITSNIRKKLGIKKNGTIAKCTRKGDFNFPYLKNLYKELVLLPGLQPYISEDAIKLGSNITIMDVNSPEKPIKLERKTPSGKIVFEKEIKIKGYHSSAKFILKKSDKEVLNDKILIKSGDYRCHEESFLKPQYADNPYLQKYFGEIMCEGLHEKNIEFRASLKDDTISQANPNYTIDWTRRGGLNRKHPFVQSLIEACEQHLADIIKKEEAADNKNKNQTSSKEQKVLNEFADIGRDLINEEIDPDDLFDTGDWDKVRKYKSMIFPFNANMLINQEKKFTIYCVEELLIDKLNPSLTPNANGLSKFIKLPKEIKLEQHSDPEANGIYKGEFTLKSLTNPADGVVQFFDGDTAICLLKVTISEKLLRNFTNDLEFEHDSYKVLLHAEKKPRKIRLFAKYPDLVKGKQIVNPAINNQNIKFKGSPQAEFKVVNKSNYAVAEFYVTGRYLNETSTITASVNGVKAVCLANVVEKEDSGEDLKIDKVDIDFGKNRYYWKTPGRHLEITTRHPLTKNVLISGNENTQEYRILMTEICADAFTVARGQRVTKHMSEQYEEWTQLQSPNDIFIDVNSELSKIKNDVLMKLGKLRMPSND